MEEYVNLLKEELEFIYGGVSLKVQNYISSCCMVAAPLCSSAPVPFTK